MALFLLQEGRKGENTWSWGNHLATSWEMKTTEDGRVETITEKWCTRLPGMPCLGHTEVAIGTILVCEILMDFPPYIKILNSLVQRVSYRCEEEKSGNMIWFLSSARSQDKVC